MNMMASIADLPLYIGAFNTLAEQVHADNVKAGWWTDLATNERKERNVGELLMLVVSEISEADEGQMLHLFDDKLPHREMVEVELADAKIRILDIAGAYALDLTGAAIELLQTFPTEYRAHHFGGSRPLLSIVGEISRAMEGDRKNANHAQFPARGAFEVGLAAALVRIHRLAEALHLDIDAAMQEKRAFNAIREDHKVESRMKADGKKY